VNRCGAPNGYLLVNVQGDDISWQYKATGRPLDYQFRVYRPGEFQSQPEYLVVNLWDYDPAWTIQYDEDGIEKKGVLEAFDDEDQDFITMKKGKGTGYHTLHLFRVRPSSDKVKKITITATNRFGQSFHQTVDL
ncbi:calcineurin-like phosphoesterase C-terminal domain-containing protein, partial [Bacteroides thetaiotaomicron]